MAVLAILVGLLTATTGVASASTGGSAQADGVVGAIGPVSVLGVEVVPALPVGIVSVATPAPNASGNGTLTDSVLSAEVGGLLTAAVVTGTTVRTTDGLSAQASSADVDLTLFGTEVVHADAVSSAVSCPIDELLGSPTAQADVVGLTIGGASAALGTTLDVGVDIGNPLAELVVRVTVSEREDTTATTADAAGLVIHADLVGTVFGLPFSASLLDVEIAGSGCSRPAGEIPTAASLTPPSGPEGTVVTVTGTGFIPGETSVEFGAQTIAPADVTVTTTPSADYGTTLQFTVPNGSPLGPTSVVAVTSVGSSTPALSFTVTPLPPTAASLTPPSGPEGTVVTVTGTGFVPGATTIDIAGMTVDAADVSVAGDGNTLTFAVPTGAPLGATTVVATTAGGSTGPLAFTVTPAPPVATGLNPGSGPVGTTVTVDGANFVPGATTVVIGGVTVPPTAVTVLPGGDQLVFTVPVGTPVGVQPVTVTTAGGTSAPLTFEVTTTTGGGSGGGGTGGGSGTGTGGGSGNGAAPATSGGSGTLPYTGPASALPLLLVGLVLALMGALAAGGARFATRTASVRPVLATVPMGTTAAAGNEAGPARFLGLLSGRRRGAVTPRC